jgi:hypothetical protein
VSDLKGFQAFLFSAAAGPVLGIVIWLMFARDCGPAGLGHLVQCVGPFRSLKALVGALTGFSTLAGIGIGIATAGRD